MGHLLGRLEQVSRADIDNDPNADNPLAKYKGGISTAGLATVLGLQTAAIRKYLEQLNALGVCSRIKEGGTQGVFLQQKN